MRVCYLIDRLIRGGTELHLLRLIRSLDRAKVQPFLCLLDGEDDESQALEPDDCPVLRLGVKSLHSPSTFVRAVRFARFLRRERIDIVEVYFPDSTYFGALTAKLAGVPHVIGTRRNLGHWMRPIDRFVGRFFRRLISVTVANCEVCRRAVIEQERAAPDSVVVLQNGLDIERFADIPPLDATVNGRPRYVGMVANLRPVKGPDVFLRAAATVIRSHPNTIFRIAGTGDIESARQLAEQLGIADRVEFLGRVEDIPAFLADIDVAVLTSRSEGLSNSLLEYMAAGRPIVATAVGGNVELIEDGVTGLLVPAGDPEALAEGIDRLLQTSTLAVALGVAARMKACAEYSSEAMMRQYERFYCDLTIGNS